MSTDYIVASLPALVFDESTPMTWEKFCELTGDETTAKALANPPAWQDLETQLRNAMAEARGGAQYARAATGCSLYWKNRVLACFQESDVAKRDAALDRVWWDAAEELTNCGAPLGRGALETYAVRLKIALKRMKISKTKGNEAFDRLTAETKR